MVKRQFIGVGSFLPHCGSQDQNWVVRLGGRPLYLLSQPCQLGNHLFAHRSGGGSWELCQVGEVTFVLPRAFCLF